LQGQGTAVASKSQKKSIGLLGIGFAKKKEAVS
jgi:hypothetical protein